MQKADMSSSQPSQPTPAGGGIGVVRCRRCHRMTPARTVKVKRHSWLWYVLFGPLFLAPESREVRCDNCGAMFVPKPAPIKMADRITGILLAAFCLGVLAVIVLLLTIGKI